MSWRQEKFFIHDEFRLAYREAGEGPPILLIHGFASNSHVNWVTTGWFATLLEAGYRVIAIDNRGHGFSDKSYEIEDYSPLKMADDAAALLKYLAIDKAHIMGYSMGARISAFLAKNHSALVKTVIFGGLGIGMVTGAGHWEPVQKALLATDKSTITHERGLLFRNFAERTKSDRHALAACIIGSKQELSVEEVKEIKAPALVVVGSKDDISGAAEPLAEMLPQGESFVIDGKDHMLAVGDKAYKGAVLSFLKRH